MTNPFYESKKWKRKRQAILRRDKYQCQVSKRYGKNATADTVHHIYPLEDYPELALQSWNLVSVSHTKHNAMHDRYTNQIIGEGIALQNKFKNNFENFFKQSPPP